MLLSHDATRNGLLVSGVLAVLTAVPMMAGAHEQEPQEQEEAAGHRAQVLHLTSKHEVTLGAGLTIVGQGMRGNDDGSGLTYSVDLAFEGNFGEKGKAFIYIDSAQGEGIQTGAAMGPNADNETGDVTTGGYSDTRIAEAWYQFPVGKKVTVTIGKIDATGIYDGNEVANDETTQFLGSTFVNNPAIGFPGYVGGINVGFAPTDNVTINVGTFESASDFAGTLSDSFMIGELALSGKIAGRDGNVRLTLWKDDAIENDGVALSADQAVTGDITLFARYGTQDDSQSYDRAFTLGGQWALGKNTLGLGYGLLSATGTGDDESHIELYCNHELSDNVHVTLDLQSVSNPGFDGTQDDVFVYGMRAQIDL